MSELHEHSALRLVDPDPDPEDGARELALEGGGSARLERGPEGEQVLRVRDARGALIFEHQAHQTVLHVPDGDLVLRAPKGDVRIEGGRVALEAEADE